MNYFELHIGDYLTDTIGLTLLEHGAYFRLLLAYYKNEGALSPKEIPLLCGGRLTVAERRAANKVIEFFFPLGPDNLHHNKRADREINKIQKLRENGRKGGRPVNQDDNQNDNQSDNQNESKGEPPISHLPSNHLPRGKPLTPFFDHLIPEGLRQTVGFLSTWREWCEYRSTERKPALTEKAARLQLEFLAGQSDPIAVIEISIRNQWKGLFEPKTLGKFNGKPKLTGEQIRANANKAGAHFEAIDAKFARDRSS